MRLLDVNDVNNLAFYEPPPNKIPKYAILSHRWLDGEVSFQEVLTEAGKKKAGYEKIKKCAQTAREHGFGYIWVDTCCIDKSSSAELSQAINSMAQWYAEAAICYAYLADVAFPEDYVDEEEIESFWEKMKQSDWFKRGWTLQELIFPKELWFYARDWHYIASKSQFSIPISSITGIDSELLSAEDPERKVHRFSVAERMSWAARRITARPEDVAYCLIGLFGVNVPLLYGEGGIRAFRRLQGAIISLSDDHSLLAWLSLKTDLDNDNDGLPSIGPLAESPDQFTYSGAIVPVPTGIGYPSFNLTSRGLCINLQIDRHQFPKVPNMCVAWLDCAERGCPNRIAISLQYLPVSGTYCINKRSHPGSVSAPLDAARETILIDNLASYSTVYKSLGPVAFVLRSKGASQLHDFKPQAIFPDAGWISKSQIILPFETSPGDWRFGVIFMRSQPEQSEFAVIAGFIDCDKGPYTWCQLAQWNHNTEDLEASVRIQVPSGHAVHQSTLSLGEEVVILEIGNREFSHVADGQFDVWLRFEKETNQSEEVFA